MYAVRAGKDETSTNRLDPALRAALQRRAQWRCFAVGEVLTRQGEAADGVLIIESGLVKVSVSSPGGAEVVVGFFGRDHLLGEMSTLRRTPRSATVVGHLPGSVLRVGAGEFRDLLAAHPDLMVVLLAAANQRLLDADRHRLAVAANDVAGRVVGTLVSWASAYGRGTDHGIVIGLRATRRELAQVVTASEKTVDDVLTSLRRAGLVQTGRRRFVVRDVAALERWACDRTPR